MRHFLFIFSPQNLLPCKNSPNIFSKTACFTVSSIVIPRNRICGQSNFSETAVILYFSFISISAGTIKYSAPVSISRRLYTSLYGTSDLSPLENISLGNDFQHIPSKICSFTFTCASS